MGYYDDIIVEPDAAIRKQNLEKLIARRMPTEVLVLTVVSIVSDDDVIRKIALERIDARNSEDGDTALRVIFLLESWREEGEILLWPEPMGETHRQRAAEIINAQDAGHPLSSAVRRQTEQRSVMAIDDSKSVSANDAVRILFEEAIPQMPSLTRPEIEAKLNKWGAAEFEAGTRERMEPLIQTYVEHLSSDPLRRGYNCFMVVIREDRVQLQAVFSKFITVLPIFRDDETLIAPRTEDFPHKAATSLLPEKSRSSTDSSYVAEFRSPWWASVWDNLTALGKPARKRERARLRNEKQERLQDEVWVQRLEESRDWQALIALL